METKIIYTKNEYNLGDNILCFIMFSKIKKYIEENNIYFYFFCKEEHIHQINEFNISKNITILPNTQIPGNEKIYDLWMGAPHEYDIFQGNDYYDIFLCKFYNKFLELIGIPIKLYDFILEDDNLPQIANDVNMNTNNKYVKYDILVINGTPNYRNEEYNIEQWNDFISRLSKKYTVITTQKVENVSCTRDDNLTAKQISAISANASIIIAIDSGVATTLFNKYTIQNAEEVYYICKDNACHITFSNFIKKNNINELEFLLYDNIIEPFGQGYSGAQLPTTNVTGDRKSHSQCGKHKVEERWHYMYFFVLFLLCCFIFFIILLYKKNKIKRFFGGRISS
jgi:hypothetical protein